MTCDEIRVRRAEILAAAAQAQRDASLLALCNLTFIRLVRICFRLPDAGGRLQGWLPCPARGARALAIRRHRTGSTVNPFPSPQSQ
jgi:hypothetical protein